MDRKTRFSGGTPYGATTLAGDGSRQPSDNELAIARTQGRHVAEIAQRIKHGDERRSRQLDQRPATSRRIQRLIGGAMMHHPEFIARIAIK